MIRFFRVVKAAIDVLRKAPGSAIVVQVKTGLGEDREIEYYQLPGMSAAPTPNDRITTVAVDGYQVAVASHNYKISLNTESGGVTLYSTDAAGDTIQARIDLYRSGKVAISNTAEDFKTLFDEILDEIIALQTTGSPTNHALNPASIAALTALKTRVGLLLGEVE